MRSLLFGLALGALAAGATSVAAQVSVDAPTIVIGKEKTGSTVIYLRQMSGGSGELSMELRVQAFSLGPGLPALEAKAKVADPTAATPATPATANDVYTAKVPSNGAVVPVKVHVTDFTEVGPATATLLGNGKPIGTITAVRYDVPFAVKLEGTPAERPEITFQSLPPGPLTGLVNGVRSVFSRDGDREAPDTGPQEARLVVKNDDALTYAVDWEVAVNDVPITGTATLARSGPTIIRVRPNPKWFRGATSHLRDDLQDGQLVLRFRPASLASSHAITSKVLPLRARLRSGSLQRQIGIGTAVVAALVFLGGLTSLLLRFWIPNRVQGIDLQEQLAAITVRTRALSPVLDSSVRVLVRVQRQRLSQLATSRVPFSPDWSATLVDCTRRVGMLTRQLDLLEAIGRLAETADKRRTDPVAPASPTLLDGVQTHLKAATDKLSTTEPKEVDLQAAQTAVGDAEALLRVIDNPSPTLEEEIKRRFTDLEKWRAANPGALERLANHRLAVRLRTALSIDNVVVAPATYASVDLFLLRVDLLRKQVTLFEQSPQAVKLALGGDKGQEQKFTDALDVDAWGWFRDARSLQRQMDQDTYIGKVQAAIVSREIDILPSLPGAASYEPVRFRAWFRSEPIGRCQAREELNCRWAFLHPGDTTWNEDGWEVWHYFPKDGDYRIEVTFTDRQTGTKVDVPGGPIVLEAFPVRTRPSKLLGPRTRLELIRFGIVFGAALLGLLAGARDQLVKLDLIGGIIAVFLLGFSADAIKNLITGK